MHDETAARRLRSERAARRMGGEESTVQSPLSAVASSMAWESVGTEEERVDGEREGWGGVAASAVGVGRSVRRCARVVDGKCYNARARRLQRCRCKQREASGRNKQTKQRRRRDATESRRDTPKTGSKANEGSGSGGAASNEAREKRRSNHPQLFCWYDSLGRLPSTGDRASSAMAPPACRRRPGSPSSPSSPPLCSL